MTIAEAARVGAELREARLALGASLEEVADELRINRRYIAALEEGRTGELPAPVYALGFVRSYATALGLDADDLARRYRSVAGGGEDGPRAARRGGVAAALAVLGLLVLGAGYAAWLNLGDAPGAAPAAGEARAPAVPAPAAVPAEGGTTRPAVPPPPSAGAARPAAHAEASSRVTLRATDETWVQVRDPASGATVLNRVLRAGESVAVPREGLALTAGKAQAVEVLLDGHATQALAGRTGLVRDVPLAPEGLRPARPAPGAPPAR
ncbi:helix-turn-helix domain-containing protein [Muricoccus nepalensis]|nr:helix-turn-helix domain-containing protein [Roseomonas nepalensis]